MVGSRLRQARLNAHMTLKQVAQIMNTTHATISRYENEKRKMEPDILIAFCKIYNVSADYLLGLPKDLPYPDI